MSSSPPGTSVRPAGTHWVIAFAAMASPCEILVRCDTASEAERLAALAVVEAQRIESRYSRYRDDSIVQTINQANGAPVQVDEETSRLLRYAQQCHELSDGRFDITSGVLRRAWSFDGTPVVPDRKRIAQLCRHVGWSRVHFDGATIRLQPGMEIDFGGIGKEYAADRVAQRVADAAGVSVLVNFGGDIRVLAVGDDRRPWTVGIEAPGSGAPAGRVDVRGRAGGRIDALGHIDIVQGGLATSGDARRFCIVDGKRLGHILDPRTGWPVAGAPRSVSVVADNCTAAGFLATMAMLHGRDAEAFLEAQDVVHHCVRPSKRRAG